MGFNRTGGGYIMANSINNQWLETDPKKHVEISARRKVVMLDARRKNRRR